MVSQASPDCPVDSTFQDENGYGALVENRSTRTEPAIVSLCPPQNSTPVTKWPRQGTAWQSISTQQLMLCLTENSPYLLQGTNVSCCYGNKWYLFWKS